MLSGTSSNVMFQDSFSSRGQKDSKPCSSAHTGASKARLLPALSMTPSYKYSLRCKSLKFSLYAIEIITILLGSHNPQVKDTE